MQISLSSEFFYRIVNLNYPFRTNLRGHARTVSKNITAKFEVRSALTVLEL